MKNEKQSSKSDGQQFHQTKSDGQQFHQTKSDGQQFHRNQQNEQSSFTSHWSSFIGCDMNTSHVMKTNCSTLLKQMSHSWYSPDLKSWNCVGHSEEKSKISTFTLILDKTRF